jgi:hypothetical protein
MLYNILLTRCADLRDVCFPFPVTFVIRRGNVSVTRKAGGFGRAYDEYFTIPAHLAVDIEIMPDSSGAASVSISMDESDVSSMPGCFTFQLRDAMRQRVSTRQVSREVAAAVFLNPEADWDIELLASLAGTTRRKFQRRLLTESHCLTGIIKQQTRQRRLLDMLADVTRSGGWSLA